MANLAPDICGVWISKSGEILHTTTDEGVVDFDPPYLPSVTEYGLPLRQPTIPVVLRSKLTVVKRIAYGIDQVSYVDPSSDKRKLATLKSAFKRDVVGGGLWTDIQALRCLPPHLNIVSLLSLVVEEISGLGIAGFTMPFMCGYTLLYQQALWSFPQIWLHELIGAVDFLNLQGGIQHNDISTQNIFINTATNSLVLLDLGSASQTATWRTGGKGYVICPSSVTSLSVLSPEDMQKAAQSDVEHATWAVASHIVRDPSLRPRCLAERNEMGRRLRNRELWVRHADVELDADILVLYDTLIAWTIKRRDGPLPCDAPHPIVLPGYWREPPNAEADGKACPSLSWLRPPLSQLDPDRPILATGRYADEEPETELITVPDPSRGFPQPLLEA